MSKMCIYLVANNYWVYKGCFDVINVCINWVSTIFGLTHSAINELHCPILRMRMYRSALLRKRKMTQSLPDRKILRQRSVNDFWHCVMKYAVGCAVTVRHNQTIGSHSTEQWWWKQFYCVLKMSVNRASPTFGLGYWKLHGLCGDDMP